MGKNDYLESRVVDCKNKGDSLRQKPRRFFPGLSLPWVAEVHGNRTHLRQRSLPHTGSEVRSNPFQKVNDFRYCTDFIRFLLILKVGFCWDMLGKTRHGGHGKGTLEGGQEDDRSPVCVQGGSYSHKLRHMSQRPAQGLRNGVKRRLSGSYVCIKTQRVSTNSLHRW